jgi:hypothetical protein
MVLYNAAYFYGSFMDVLNQNVLSKNQRKAFADFKGDKDVITIKP